MICRELFTVNLKLYLPEREEQNNSPPYNMVLTLNKGLSGRGTHDKKRVKTQMLMLTSGPQVDAKRFHDMIKLYTTSNPKPRRHICPASTILSVCQ